MDTGRSGLDERVREELCLWQAVTADKVDLVVGPYSTAPILAAMGVAARYNKVFIQNTMGVPSLRELSTNASKAANRTEDTLGAVVKERDDLDLVRDNLEEITSGA